MMDIQDHICTGGTWDNKKKQFVCDHQDTPNTDEWLEDWFYEYATREPDDTFTLVLHEIHGWEEAKTAIQEHINRQIVEAEKRGMEKARSRVLRRTEIPRDAKNPTRDYVVVLGEEIADIIAMDITELTAHQANRNGENDG